MREWLKTNPNDVPIHLQLAEAYMSTGKESEAIAAYEQIIKLTPAHVLALNNLAWLNRDSNAKKSMGYAQQAYQLAPKSPIVLDTLGMLTLKAGDASRAATLLRDAAARAPADAQIQVHLATVLLQQKRFAEARKILDAILKAAPGSPAAKEAQALLDTFAGNK